MTRLIRCLFGCAVLLSGASIANAALITFDLTYTGIDNGATGTGQITFDDTVLPNPGFLVNVDSGTLGVAAFAITIAGASSGNGTFGLAQVTNWIWDVSAPLDLGAELVGQAGFGDFNWCVDLFDGCTAPAPGGIGPFSIQTNAETGDLLQLASMKPATATPTPVPEPGSLALFAVGLGLAGLRLMRRRRSI